MKKEKCGLNHMPHADSKTFFFALPFTCMLYLKIMMHYFLFHFNSAYNIDLVSNDDSFSYSYSSPFSPISPMKEE